MHAARSYTHLHWTSDWQSTTVMITCKASEDGIDFGPPAEYGPKLMEARHHLRAH